ncbi:GumC family protein [Vulgatibacter incomptus]|uniref:Lipopolysaccharide biosynthesis chain length determinant protein n=1 Tax=Vulgatibacter incomptus TaxID=1391653 RepID=A0A0K1PAV3_9BACT|nr:Wzz/FepE/Etk N-terminal domain-containing protein [Vulgatibacter incomptus]AKU90655.1 Lipopolysaccharide biosynthesis chain length determinant protein [Vulgatibacter incomptus]
MEPGRDKSLSMEQLLVGLWHHRLLVAGCVGAALFVGALYVALKPTRYTATTVVRVEAQFLPERYVSPTVTEQIQQRLATVRHEMLSPKVLEKVIVEQDLFAGLRASDGMNAALQAMRASIEVKVEGENAFVLAYSARTPQEAATVANRLPEVYALIALEERAEAAERVASIFSAELERIRPQAEAFEARLVQFKADHAHELPEVLESNLRQLDRLNGLMETTLASLSDAQRRRTALARYGLESSVEVTRLAAAMNDARRELSSLQSIYTPDHPEVVSANRAWLTAKARFDKAAEAGSRGDSEQARIDSEIRWLKDVALSYQQRIDDILTRVEKTPAVGTELSVINRDYDVIREKYTTLLSRKVEAELAQDLERRQKTSLFRVLEPAMQPLTAAEPKAMSAMGIALLLGLGAGLAAGGWAASRDTSIRGVADARQRLGLQVLATVPSLEGRARR